MGALCTVYCVLCTVECPDVYGQFKLALDKQLTGGQTTWGKRQTVPVKDTGRPPSPHPETSTFVV